MIVSRRDIKIIILYFGEKCKENNYGKRGFCGSIYPIKSIAQTFMSGRKRGCANKLEEESIAQSFTAGRRGYANNLEGR
ncbi:MAG: hypothetical protein AB1393_08500 [Candidatus Edwardsbacteria bacterium]